MQDLIPLVDVTAKVVKEHDAWWTKIKASISMQDKTWMMPRAMQNQGLRLPIKLLDIFSMQSTTLEI